MGTRGRSLSILVHADTKVGKSTFANTAPAPRLLIDAEAAHRFLPGRKVFWEPRAAAPPVADGTWDTAVVVVREYSDMVRAAEWLKSGQHPFESVIIDSMSEIQVKAKEQLGAGDGMDQRKWGQLLDHMEQLIRGLRDLTEHPTTPITAIVITAMTEKRDEKWRPYVQGQFRVKFPYFIDIVGYMFIQSVPSPDPTQAPVEMRRMLTRPHPQFEAGERVQGRIPQYVDGDAISVPWLLDSVFGPDPALQQAGSNEVAPAADTQAAQG